MMLFALPAKSEKDTKKHPQLRVHFYLKKSIKLGWMIFDVADRLAW